MVPDAFSIDTPIDPASLIEKAIPPVSCTPSPFGETVPRSAAGPTAASAGATLSMRTASVRRDATLPAASVAAYVIVCAPSAASSIGPVTAPSGPPSTEARRSVTPDASSVAASVTEIGPRYVPGASPAGPREPTVAGSHG